MTITTTTSTSTHGRRMNVRNLVVGAVVMAAATSGVLALRATSGSGAHAGTKSVASVRTTEKQYVDGIAALTLAQLAAGFGNISAATSYVDGIAARTPAQLAAGFGNVSLPTGYVAGIMGSSPAQLTAAFGNVPSATSYVDGIMASTPAQLAAAFGNGA